MSYIIFFILSTVLSLIITPIIKHLAVKTKVLDAPTEPRKIHTKPMPLLGGFAVFLSFVLALSAYLKLGDINFMIVPPRFFSAIIVGALILMVGGYLDDKYQLSPKVLWLFPAFASLTIVLSGIGIGIDHLSNPFGAPINISYNFQFSIFNFQLPAILVWLWLMGMIFTTKFLDGLDGLCSGIGLIAGLTMFALSITPRINQPITATLAIIFAGALFGYLFFAFNPASIFLGESGSTFIGFMIGVLSIILGGKIATALIVMGIPILDIAWVIVRRIFYGQSPFKGDRKHLHHRLMDIGFSQKQTVLILYAISAIFGFTAVFLQSFGKLIALLVLFCVMLTLAISVVVVYKKQHPHVPDSPA